MKRYLIIFSLLFFCAGILAAQELNNFRARKILILTDTIQIDSLSIIPGSVVISDLKGNIIKSNRFKVDYVRSVMIVDASVIGNYKELNITYRTFPFNFSKTYYHKDPEKIEPDEKGMVNPFMYSYNDNNEDLFDIKGLSKSGSISRGISFGNNQDVVVNSNFNLQLSGSLGEDVEILAAVTDDNIPIQPEGNTQQIQEFDKVFIQLGFGKSRLIAGDFELENPDSYFMNYYKKAQGGKYQGSFTLSDDKRSILKLEASAAVSKGKFARNTFIGIEGNQGPYKLTGNENESFIVILAGSEKVYIDGQLLDRGQENDYVIDYNTAEVTFTPKRIITKDKRILIEFEYADRRYARSLFYIGSEYRTKKLKIRLNAFSEQDIKNQSIQPELDDQQKSLLSRIGDSLNDAIYTNVDSVGFSSDEVLYKMIDTLVNGFSFDSVFVYSTNPDSAMYRLGFTNVGQGNGFYIQIQNAANGRVFKWVAPDSSGKLTGSHEPIMLIITPKKKQMISFSTEYVFSEGTKAFCELAMSNNDINLFSDKDKNDNLGYAIKLGFENQSSFGKNIEDPWSLKLGTGYELVNKDFSAIEPYRHVEFNRDWNIPETNIYHDEHLINMNMELEKADLGNTKYRFELFDKGNDYNAYLNALSTSWKYKGYQFKFNGSLMNNDNISYASSFLKHQLELSKSLKWVTLGLKDSQEKNEFRDNQNNTLLGNSFSFREWEFYILNPDTSRNKFRVNYNLRIDQIPLNNGFAEATLAKDFGLAIEILQFKNDRINIKATHRKLQIYDTILVSQEEENTIVGRIEYYTKKWNGFITSNLFYEVGSGLELKKEFTYLKVADGEGTYTWTDYNNDGVEQLDEFEVAVFKDQGNYIRIYTPGNDYERIYSNQFSEALSINPSSIISKKKGFLKLLSRFYNQSVYRIEQKTNYADFEKSLNPFNDNIDSKNLVTLNSSFRNTLYFNRNHSKFGADLNYQYNGNKALLLNGFDSRSLSSISFTTRWNINRVLSIRWFIKDGLKSNTSEFFSNRDYNIKSIETEPEFIYQPNSTFRLSFTANYREKENTSGIDNEKSIQRNMGVELNYRVVKKGSFLVKFNYIKIDYNNVTNNAIAYEMLESLQPGNNVTWSVSYQRSLASNVQLNLIYDGRKVPEVSTIHIGNVMIRAYF